MFCYIPFKLLARLQNLVAFIFFISGSILLITNFFDTVKCSPEVLSINNQNLTAQQVKDYCIGKSSPFIRARQYSQNNLITYKFNLPTLFIKLFIIAIYNWLCVYLWSKRSFMAKKRKNISNLILDQPEAKNDKEDIFTVQRLKETFETPDFILEQLIKYLWFCIFFSIFQFFYYIYDTFLIYVQKRSFFIIPDSFRCVFIDGFYRPLRSTECTINLNILHNLIFHLIHHIYLLLIIVNLILIVQLIILSFSKSWRFKILRQILPELKLNLRDYKICERLSGSSKIFFVIENLAGKELQKSRDLIDALIKEHLSENNLPPDDSPKQNEVV